jgi:hypothetical protein
MKQKGKAYRMYEGTFNGFKSIFKKQRGEKNPEYFQRFFEYFESKIIGDKE